MPKPVFQAFDGTLFDTEDDAKAYERERQPGERTLVFWGHSDDVICIDNCYGPKDNEEVYHSPILVTDADNHRVYIHVEYGKARTGCWMVGIGPVDEDEDLPEWAQPTIRFEGYTAMLELTVPADVYVVIPKDED